MKKNNLKKIRIDAVMTQRELAEKSGLSTVTISFLENGHTKEPMCLTKKRLALALGVEVNDIFPGTAK